MSITLIVFYLRPHNRGDQRFFKKAMTSLCIFRPPKHTVLEISCTHCPVLNQHLPCKNLKIPHFFYASYCFCTKFSAILGMKLQITITVCQVKKLDLLNIEQKRNFFGDIDALHQIFLVL